MWDLFTIQAMNQAPPLPQPVQASDGLARFRELIEDLDARGVLVWKTWRPRRRARIRYGKLGRKSSAFRVEKGMVLACRCGALAAWWPEYRAFQTIRLLVVRHERCGEMTVLSSK